MANTKKEKDQYWLPNRLLFNNDDWRMMPSDTLMKCDVCKHEAQEWAEHDEVVELVGLEQEECYQVRCPNCKSWFYWDKDEN